MKQSYVGILIMIKTPPPIVQWVDLHFKYTTLQCGYSTMASASAFQAEDEGSIPFTRSQAETRKYLTEATNPLSSS